MIRFALFALIEIIWMSSAVAQTSTPSKEDQTSAFFIEKNLVDKVYRQSTDEESPGTGQSGAVRPQVGILAPTDFLVANDYFAVDYAQELGSFPFFAFALSQSLFTTGPVRWIANAEAGYAYKQGSYKAKSISGTTIEDSITLQWAPMTAGLGVTYETFRWLHPTLEVSAGAHWIHHTGTIDGLDHSEWVPVFGGGPSLTFFPNQSQGDAFFSGVTVSAIHQRSSGSTQNIRGWEYKLGSTVKL